MILDFPANYAKIGSALLRTGRFNGSKLFVAGGWPATIPSFIPTASLEGARGTSAGVAARHEGGGCVPQLYTNAPGTKDRQTLELEQLRRRA